MINSWSLLHDVLNGTIDKEYPIMKDTKITPQESDEYDIPHSDAYYDYKRNDPDRENPFTDPKDRERAERVVNASRSKDIDLDKELDWIEKSGGYEWTPGSPWPPNVELADVDDRSAHHFNYPYNSGFENVSLNDVEAPPWVYESPDGGETVTRRKFGSMDKEVIKKPEPDLGYKSQKYEEDKGMKDLKDYISSTYSGHYTSDQNSTQTLDLIQSVGDAESFCRSNAIKYLARYDRKGQAKRDILKAMHYCLLLYYFSGQTNENEIQRGYETF